MSKLLDELNNYEKSLDDLENSKSSLNSEKVFDILLIRDRIEKILQREDTISASSIILIMELDNRLKLHSSKVAKYFNLANEYKNNNKFLQEKWWWQLDDYTKQSHPWNRFDGFISAIRLSLWTFNIALLGTLVSRLIGSSSGIIGPVTIAISAFIPILQAKSELTQSGHEDFNNILKKLKIPQYLYEEAKLLSMIFGTGLLLFFWYFIPIFVAQDHFTKGVKNQFTHNDLKEAEVHYLKAIELNPNLVAAYHNLGYIYDVGWGDLQTAEKYYFSGVKENYIPSFLNLGRLYILMNNPDKALLFLKKGISKIGEKERKNITDEERKLLFQQRYSFHKNMGWAQFYQKDYEKAAQSLDIAKNNLEQLEKDKQLDYIKSPGSVYCLLAQLPQTQKVDSYKYWEKCQKLIKDKLAAEEILPEEKKWLLQSKKILEEQKK